MSSSSNHRIKASSLGEKKHIVTAESRCYVDYIFGAYFYPSR